MKNCIDKIAELQLWLKNNGLGGCIIPNADPHQSEYVEDYYKLRGYFSGFTGSAGTLVVTCGKAALFTDSRYHIQASIQLEGSGIELFKSGLPDVPLYYDWLQGEVGGAPVAANAYLFSIDDWEMLANKLKIQNNSGFESLWEHRPALCDSKIYIHAEQYSGESVKSKLERVRQILRDNGAELCIVSNLDDIAWLLNIRGADVAYNPVVRSYVIVTEADCVIFTDYDKISQSVGEYFASNGILVKPYNAIADYLTDCTGRSVLFDRGSLNYSIYEKVKNCKSLVNLPLYISRLRAVKNSVEIEGYRNAMEKDGVVWVRFLQWFYGCLEGGLTITELDVMSKIRELKEAQDEFVDESFGTIAGYAEHGAIGHYAATADSNYTIERRSFLVIDTGTHYLNGTTDTTRTLSCGELTD
ncbi:MAG: aminopeptidase P family N-terminal domain-containing protein, partial [Paludibacteraceae bacterium]|nr:aminopeptidase P family N-terminal domain-containing protein [Paludibacteraceae bacterium]